MCYYLGVLKRMAERAQRLREVPRRVDQSLSEIQALRRDAQALRAEVESVRTEAQAIGHYTHETIAVLQGRLESAQARIAQLEPLASLEPELDALRSRYDLGDALADEFQRARETAEYRAVYANPSPLVSVCIATYNRAEILVTRALRSALSQDWPALEVIVVGDGCTDDTEARVASLGDPRVRFVNLPARGVYPSEPHWRWMVAGTPAVNYALELARGDFITHLDDDDEHAPDRLRKLVGHLHESGADLVWHPFHAQTADGSWTINSAEAFRKNQITTSSVLYHQWFRRIPWDLHAYRYHEPGDWNRFRKLRWLGARTVRFNEPLLRHYKERQQHGP